MKRPINRGKIMSNESMGSKSILVIDDDQMMLKLATAFLEIGGFDVITTADGVSGMKLLRESKVDLVLLDILMPGLDGYKVLQLIREYSSVPVIMVTGITDKVSTTKFLDLGADDYVTKPFNKRVLIARIRSKIKHAKD